MKISITVCDPSDISKVHFEQELADFPTSCNFLTFGDKMYIICHTLFKTKSVQNYYLFEQTIRPFKSNDPDTFHPPHLLLLGKIFLEDDEEIYLFKEINITGRDVNSKNVFPYKVMRVLDCIEVENTIYTCEKIIVKEIIQIEVRIFGSPLTLENFRKDDNRFCHNIQL